MNIDKRWFLLLTVAASATAGAVVALTAHRRHHRAAHALQHTTALKSWENEGGNLAPAQVVAALP